PRTVFFDTPPPCPRFSTLSLHAALPICGAENGFDERGWLRRQGIHVVLRVDEWHVVGRRRGLGALGDRLRGWLRRRSPRAPRPRSEEHTSELQSRSDLVCRLLPEKKKKK